MYLKLLWIFSALTKMKPLDYIYFNVNQPTMKHKFL